MKISKYNFRPNFSNASSVYSPEVGVFAKLYLDINKNKINDFSFEQSGLESWIPSFSQLGESVLGQDISLVKEISFGDKLINLPVKLLNQAIDEYRGVTYRNELLKEKADTLVCRCLGVYEGQIIDVLKSNLGGDSLAILDETGATGGCSSCLLDVENIIKDFHGEMVPSSPEKERILGMTPAQLVLKIDSLLGSENEVVEIKSNLVLLKVSTDKKVIEENLKAQFGTELFFSFL